ncbi:MAG: TIGR02530 family flagellar biosynthesis protein [Oscillospiraceae bacterium]
MLISEYLQTRNVSVTTGSGVNGTAGVKNGIPIDPKNSPFAQELKAQLEKQDKGVEFSRHAIDRISDRNIDMVEGDKLERLNKAVELAQQKGSTDALVLVDSTAFLVSVKNNKVITTLSADDLKGNIFTNIDSTVII